MQVSEIATETHTIIEEFTTNNLVFNVMPNKNVEESLFIKQYRIGENYIEGHFDRSYTSSMQNSPSHLVSLSVMIHWQKIVYVYCCYQLGLKYDPFGPELVKIWPTKTNMRLPKLEVEEVGLVQRCWVKSFVSYGKNDVYKICANTRVSSIFMSGEAVVYPANKSKL